MISNAMNDKPISHQVKLGLGATCRKQHRNVTGSNTVLPKSKSSSVMSKLAASLYIVPNHNRKPITE